VARIVVVGAGIGGLGVGLCAGTAGHEVVLVERDRTPLPADAHAAFDWERRGAPQVRHSHAFLARLRNLLRDRHPEVLAALFDAGATEMDFIASLPATMDQTRSEGDEDLVALACRRTTFEWVLRRLVLDTVDATLCHGVAMRGLEVDASGAIPRVTGVRLEDGTTLHADVVVVAGGRRSDLPGLLGAHGIEVPEEVEDTGIVYFSRFFALRDSAELPPQVGPIGGDLDHLKFGVFPGDNRTFSVTLAVHSDDVVMRQHLSDPRTFLRVAAAIPTTAPYVEEERSAPITEVEVMAGLLNRRRWFTIEDGTPRVLGLHAVGDAHTCTNPLYGRGCSLAVVQAQLFADALDAHGLGHDARARAYEAACDAEVLPWYRAAIAQDRLNRRTPSPAAASTASDGAAPTGDPLDSPDFAREFLHHGLFPALRTDPVVLRAFLRMMNLLTPPDSLIADGDLVTRVMQVYAARDARPAEPPLGPGRDELLSALAPA
jgi:2-polyprenyl-6-methoxyphenol hydroxylase-like FAD-dependent oxidoreductase